MSLKRLANSGFVDLLMMPSHFSVASQGGGAAPSSFCSRNIDQRKCSRRYLVIPVRMLLPYTTEVSISRATRGGLYIQYSSMAKEDMMKNQLFSIAKDLNNHTTSLIAGSSRHMTY